MMMMTIMMMIMMMMMMIIMIIIAVTQSIFKLGCSYFAWIGANATMFFLKVNSLSDRYFDFSYQIS